MGDLTILHTSDLHGKITPAAAERIHSEKQLSQGSILLDSGDAATSGNIYFRPGGEPILKVMSDVAYDAMAMGNREFHFLASGLKSKVSLARFPVLSANLKCKDPSQQLPVIGSITLAVCDLKVAVFGLTVPMITQDMFASRVSPYIFDDPIETAKRVVPKLRDSSDIVVALTHIGIDMDIKLAENVPGIDLILGGHSHLMPPNHVTVQNTPIFHAGCWGRYIRKVLMKQTNSGWQVTTEVLDLQESKSR